MGDRQGALGTRMGKRGRRGAPPPASEEPVHQFSRRTTRLSAQLTARGVHLYTFGGGLRFDVDDTPAFQRLRQTQLWANAQREAPALYALTAFFEGCPPPEAGDPLQ